MDISNYKPNSNKSKEVQKTPSEERKKLEKVVSGTVKTKKKSGVSKFFSDVVSDSASNIKTYIVKDVLIPAVKKGISDTIDMILYGGTRKRTTNASRVSYRSYYDEPRTRDDGPSRTASYHYDDIIIDNRGEAEAVLSQLDDAIDTYGMVSVADLYDLVGVSGDYTDNKYGWTNLRNAEVIRTRDGYRLALPKALPIK